jgi:long-chain acyl-CoA synthetase
MPAGDPKGVLLKHSAVVATVASLISFLKEVADEAIGVGDSLLSYLPLAHIFDRCGKHLCSLFIFDCSYALKPSIWFW